MLKNYLKVAFRNLLRRKGFSLINIIGLSVSVSIFIMMNIYVRIVGNTDKFHADYNRIYRVEREQIHNTPAPFGSRIKNTIPEVESYLRMNNCPVPKIVTFNDKSFRLQNLMMVDSNFFNFFSYRLIKGKPSEVLSTPNAIVISKSTAYKIFGKENPIGQLIKLNNSFALQVSGIMDDIPINSSFQADAIIPFNYNKTIYNDPKLMESLNRWNYSTFVKFQINANPKVVEEKINKSLSEFLYEKKRSGVEEKVKFNLTRLDEVYFHFYLSDDSLLHGSRSNVIIANIVSYIILFLALINFVNLSTAQATYRSKEIGIRKVTGALKSRLVAQLLIESTLIAYISMIFGAIIAEQVLPLFSSLVKVKIEFDFFNSYNMAIVFLGPLIFGFLSGAYPALYLSSFSPIKILSGEKTKGQKGAFSRNVLTITQFSAALVLIIFTFHVQKQVNYFYTKDMGFEKEHRLVLESSPELIKNREAFKNDLKSLPNVQNATFHVYPIGDIDEKWGQTILGKQVDTRVQIADSNFIYTYGIKILQGRNIKTYQSNDSIYEAVINQKALETYGLQDAIGKTINSFFKFKIVGVISDFNYETLQKPLEPFMIINFPGFRLMTINYKAGKSEEVIKQIQLLWNKYSPNYPFYFTHLDESIEKLYTEEARLKKIFEVFTLIALFIACIGLLGLAIFTVGTKVKEIGIRKSLGSTSYQIINLLLFRFIKLIGIATLIAWPIAWWFTKQWFNNFLEPVGIDYWYFILSGILTTLVAVVTIIFNAYIAANTNPSLTLKHE